MAAAYMFHLINNHPFIDGNKRIGVVSVLVFLKGNNIEITFSQDDLYGLAMKVALSKMTKNELAQEIKRFLLV